MERGGEKWKEGGFMFQAFFVLIVSLFEINHSKKLSTIFYSFEMHLYASRSAEMQVLSQFSRRKHKCYIITLYIHCNY